MSVRVGGPSTGALGVLLDPRPVEGPVKKDDREIMNIWKRSI